MGDDIRFIGREASLFDATYVEQALEGYANSENHTPEPLTVERLKEEFGWLMRQPIVQTSQGWRWDGGWTTYRLTRWSFNGDLQGNGPTERFVALDFQNDDAHYLLIGYVTSPMNAAAIVTLNALRRTEGSQDPCLVELPTVMIHGTIEEAAEHVGALMGRQAITCGYHLDQRTLESIEVVDRNKDGSLDLLVVEKPQPYASAGSLYVIGDSEILFARLQENERAIMTMETLPVLFEFLNQRQR